MRDIRVRLGALWSRAWPVLMKIAGWLLVTLGLLQILDGLLAGFWLPLLAPGLMSLVTGSCALLVTRLMRPVGNQRRR